MARRIHLSFEKEDKDLIDKLMEQLDNRYPQKGRKVHNLISAGYFDQLILPMIDVYKSQDNINYKQKFYDFYRDLLRFFPIAIFVNNASSVEFIEKEILKRLKYKRIPCIKIHAMGIENIKKVDEAIKRFKKGLSIENNKFIIPSLGLNCQVVTIKVEKNIF